MNLFTVPAPTPTSTALTESTPFDRLFIQRRPSRYDPHSLLPNDAPQEASGLCCGRLAPIGWHCDRFHPANNPAQQSSTGRYWYLWVSWPCRPLRCLHWLQLRYLPCWSHQYQAQLLPAAGLELMRLPVRDNPQAIFLISRLSAASREVSCACPPLVNFKAKMDVRLWGRN